MSEPESQHHWRSLAQQLGAPVPEPAPPRPEANEDEADTAGEESPPAPPRPAKKTPPPRQAPKRDRSHWAGLAGELGIDFPEPPEPEPEPQQETDTFGESAEQFESTGATETGDADSGRPAAAHSSTADEPAADEGHNAGGSSIVAVPPDNLIEDASAAASDMLDEISEYDVFDGVSDEDAEEEQEDFVETGVPEGAGGEAARDDSDEVEASSSERPKRRRRRGRRRRRDDDQAHGEDTLEAQDVADDDSDGDVDDDDDDDDDLDERRSQSRSRGPDRAGRGEKQRKFPTWAEAMDILVSRNQEGRKSSGGSRRSGRGRRRRPSS